MINYDSFSQEELKKLTQEENPYIRNEAIKRIEDPFFLKNIFYKEKSWLNKLSIIEKIEEDDSFFKDAFTHEKDCSTKERLIEKIKDNSFLFNLMQTDLELHLKSKIIKTKLNQDLVFETYLRMCKELSSSCESNYQLCNEATFLIQDMIVVLYKKSYLSDIAENPNLTKDIRMKAKIKCDSIHNSIDYFLD